MIRGWLCPSYRLWIWGTVVVQVCCPEVLPCSVPYCSAPFCSIQLFCSVLFCPSPSNFSPDSQFLWWFLNLPLNQGALVYFKNCIKCSAYYGLTLLPWRIEKSVCGTSHQVLIFKIFTLFHSADLPSNFIQHSKEHLHRPVIRFKKTSFLFNVKMDFHHKVFMGSFYMNSVANCICENMQNTWYVAGCELSRFVAITTLSATFCPRWRWRSGRTPPRSTSPRKPSTSKTSQDPLVPSVDRTPAQTALPAHQAPPHPHHHPTSQPHHSRSYPFPWSYCYQSSLSNTAKAQRKEWKAKENSSENERKQARNEGKPKRKRTSLLLCDNQHMKPGCARRSTRCKYTKEIIVFLWIQRIYSDCLELVESK